MLDTRQDAQGHPRASEQVDMQVTQAVYTVFRGSRSRGTGVADSGLKYCIRVAPTSYSLWHNAVFVGAVSRVLR